MPKSIRSGSTASPARAHANLVKRLGHDDGGRDRREAGRCRERLHFRRRDGVDLDRVAEARSNCVEGERDVPEVGFGCGRQVLGVALRVRDDDAAADGALRSAA
jgi:hypothetical protein